MLTRLSISILAIAVILMWSLCPRSALAADETAIETTVTVDAGQTLRTMNPRRLGGTNVAMWYFPSTYASPVVREWVRDLRAADIRIPGGSWSNVVYWNGNGVRKPDGSVDPTKVGPDGYPAVDYSDYARSFLVDSKTLHPASNGWHGHSDVKTQHEFIKDIPGTEAMACPNLGTGRPVDAAEWVRWANKKMGYDVRLWELGNEIGGSWEAGTELPFGKGQITAEMYTQRFNEMAKAMREVDPTIKIGGGAFLEETIRDCGDHLDFASIHTYPGSVTQTEAQLFADIGPGLREQVVQARNWIEKYQPQRKDKIEIAYTEWNAGFSINKDEMFSGLWASIFLGELAVQGVDLAQQWDCFADMLDVDEVKGYSRLPQYYALWMWNNYMGDRLLPATADDKTIYTYASRSDDTVSVLLVNTNRERPAKVNVRLTGFARAEKGELATITTREYHWNDQLKKPQWSTGPRIEPLATGEAFSATLAPFSMSCVRVPNQSKPELSPMAQKALAEPPQPEQLPEIRFLLPLEVYVGDTVRGEVIALGAGTEAPYRGTLAAVDLSASRSVKFDRSQMRIADAVGHFTFVVSEPGDLTLTARSGGTVATRTVRVRSSVPRPIVFWDFANPPVTDEKTFKSSYALSAEWSNRPNRAVVRINLTGQTGVGHNDTQLFGVHQMPEEGKLNKTNIRGVIADVMTSGDLSCEDPDAHIMVVMQSSANWWMHLGSIPLKPGMDWKTYQFDVEQAEHLKAMPAAHNVLFILQAKSPVKGTVFFDKIGFMVR